MKKRLFLINILIFSILYISNSAFALIGSSPMPIETQCKQDAKVCPDWLTVTRVWPNCEFAACPGETVVAPPIAPIKCKQDAKVCPDWSTVTRIWPNCKFVACPGETVVAPPVLPVEPLVKVKEKFIKNNVSKIRIYKKLILKKFGNKINQLSIEKLKKLDKAIDLKINKVIKNKVISKEKQNKYFSILSGLKEIISDKINIK